MPARSAVTMRPLMSLPNAIVSFDFEPMNSCDSMFSRSQIISRLWFGTWMPTVLLPAMRFDQNALRLESQAEVVDEIGNAAVLDAGFRLEFKRSNHRAGIDLCDLP